MTCRLLTLVGVLLVSVPGPAAAETATPADGPSSEELAARAGEHFQRGNALYAEGNFQEALEAYQQAQGLVPHPSNLFNMARCHENLTNLRAALEQYQQALHATENATERADIERRITAILNRPVRVFVTSNPPGATILVDANEGAESSSTPTSIELTPGPHHLLFRADGFQPTSHRVVVEVGQEEPVAADLLPLPRAEGCPECPEAEACAAIESTDLTGLHVHLAISVPVGIPAVGQWRDDFRLIAGAGIRAHVTRNHFIFGFIFNFYPMGSKESEEAGSEEQQRFSLINGVLEAGYAWSFERATIALLGGFGGVTEVNHDSSEDSAYRLNTSIFGWAGFGVDVYALPWLSLGMDGHLGVGGALDEGEDGVQVFIVLGAQITFHL